MTDTTTTGEFLTIAQASDLLKIHRSTLAKMGLIISVFPGSKRKIVRRADIDAHLAKMRRQAA